MDTIKRELMEKIMENQMNEFATKKTNPNDEGGEEPSEERENQKSSVKYFAK